MILNMIISEFKIASALVPSKRFLQSVVSDEIETGVVFDFVPGHKFQLIF